MVSLALPQTSFRRWLRPDQLSQLARLVNVLLVIWLAWLLAELSWLVIPEPEATGEPISDTAPAPIKRQQAKIDERQIASWHLFGVAGEQPVNKPAPVDAPDTRLKLTLRGVFASDESSRARAIVGDPKGKEKSYAIGDPLPGGAKLSEIYPDRIILERNGRFETLRLPKKRTGGRSGSVSHRSAARVRSSGSPNKAAAFQKYRKEIKQNPASFMNYVKAKPAKKDGKFIGFTLQAGKQRTAFRELGLRPGDIVTAINGVTIDSPAKGMKAMKALGEGDTINVTLLRSGQETSLSLSLPPTR